MLKTSLHLKSVDLTLLKASTNAVMQYYFNFPYFHVLKNTTICIPRGKNTLSKEKKLAKIGHNTAFHPSLAFLPFKAFIII